MNRDELMAFLEEHADDEEILDDSSLFGEGLLDSFILIELVALIESRMGVKVPPLDVNLRNFDTPQRILSYIEARRSEQAG